MVELHLQRLGICCVFVQFLCTTITHRKSTSHSFQEAVVYLVHIIRFHFHFLPIHLAGWVLSFRYKMGMPCSFSTLDSGSSPLLFGPTTVFISNLHLSTFLFIRFYRCVCDMAFCAIIADGMCAIFFFLYLSAICVCVCVGSTGIKRAAETLWPLSRVAAVPIAINGTRWDTHSMALAGGWRAPQVIESKRDIERATFTHEYDERRVRRQAVMQSVR